MSIFRKKKNNDDLKGKGKKTGSLLTAFDRMIYIQVRECADQEMFEMSNHILAGKPVLANFDKISIADGNQFLAFISGVVYASGGQIMKLNTRLFLFGNKEAYEDGSLQEYVEDIK